MTATVLVGGWIVSTAIGWRRQKRMDWFDRTLWWSITVIGWPAIIAYNAGLWQPQPWLIVGVLCGAAAFTVRSLIQLRAMGKEAAVREVEWKRRIEPGEQP